MTITEMAPAGGWSTPAYAIDVTAKEQANAVCESREKEEGKGCDVIDGNVHLHLHLPVTTRGHPSSLHR